MVPTTERPLRHLCIAVKGTDYPEVASPHFDGKTQLTIQWGSYPARASKVEYGPTPRYSELKVRYKIKDKSRRDMNMLHFTISKVSLISGSRVVALGSLDIHSYLSQAEKVMDLTGSDLESFLIAVPVLDPSLFKHCDSFIAHSKMLTYAEGPGLSELPVCKGNQLSYIYIRVKIMDTDRDRTANMDTDSDSTAIYIRDTEVSEPTNCLVI